MWVEPDDTQSFIKSALRIKFKKLTLFLLAPLPIGGIIAPSAPLPSPLLVTSTAPALLEPPPPRLPPDDKRLFLVAASMSPVCKGTETITLKSGSLWFSAKQVNYAR